MTSAEPRCEFSSCEFSAINSNDGTRADLDGVDHARVGEGGGDDGAEEGEGGGLHGCGGGNENACSGV